LFSRRHLRALWAVTLAVSLVLYQTEHALWHFLWHLSYGGSFGLFVGAAWIVYSKGSRVNWPVWAWLGYVYMIVPDLIWIGPRLAGSTVHPHQPWMDVFLGHIFLDMWTWTTPVLLPTVAASIVTYVLVRQRVTAGELSPST